MVFSSLFFISIFLPITLILYFISKNKVYRNIILLIASLIFYAWGEPVWVFIMIATAWFDYYIGKIIEDNRDNKKAKLAFIASIIINLSILGLFKYSKFLTLTVNGVFRLNLPYSEYGLPLGISFYTFQSLSYVVDVYRGEVKAQRVFYKYLLFVSLFHQLVAGPIVRYVDIANEIEDRTITVSKFSYGVTRFIIGLGKKVIIANTAGEIADSFLKSNFSTLSFTGAWLGVSMYAIQIYFDFGGYSDMAIGLGKMFGFTYKENFNYPYISKSATEFWRRWHITLSTFFRDYVYIPLGGNRKKQVRNLLIVWSLTGLWHGASWNFVLWGTYYGILIIIEKKFLLKLLEKLPNVISHAYLIFAMLVGWTLFYFTDMTSVISILQIMFGMTNNSLIDTTVAVTIQGNLTFIIVAVLASTPLAKKIYKAIKNLFNNKLINWSLDEVVLPIFNFSLFIACIILLVGGTYNPFLYFRF